MHIFRAHKHLRTLLLRWSARVALLTDSNPLFPLSWFAEACTGTSAIFIYEFDAGGL
jgi:hypothetical protein